MKILKWLDNHLEEFILGLLLVVISVVMMMQVIMRYVFSSSLAWGEELSRYAWILSAFFSIGFCIKKGSELKIDVLSKSLPIKASKILEIIIQTFCGIICGYMFLASFVVIKEAILNRQLSPAMGMPFYWLYIGASIGFCIGALRSIQVVIRMVKNLNSKKIYIGGDKIDG